MTMIEASQRDVTFTPFMLRVREALQTPDEQAARVRPSALRPIAEACDEWFYLRCRSEQMVAEANSMVPDESPLDLRDEYGADSLAFVLRCRGRSARFVMGQTGRKGYWNAPTRRAPGRSSRSTRRRSRTSSSSSSPRDGARIMTDALLVRIPARKAR